MVPLDALLSHYTEKAVSLQVGDFYIAPDGSDDNDGALERPFANFERAMRAARERNAQGLRTTVCVKAGEYHVRGLVFRAEDSGTTYRAYGDGEVTLNGGRALRPAQFWPVSGSVRERLHGTAKDAVVELNLRELGLRPADWGPVYAVGAYATAHKYDGDTVGLNCELFFNDSRMSLARYPNGKEFLRVSAVHDVGDAFEFPEQNYYPDWNERRNHWGGVYIMDKQTTERVKTWQSHKDVWAAGYFFHDWADSSTPIERFDCAHRRMVPRFVSRYGCRAGALYYLYNILEELDEPGEWYLDRDSGMLYLYPTGPLEEARIELTLSTQPLLSGVGVHDLAFEGFTFKGTRADGISLAGDGIRICRCVVKNVLGNAICLRGAGNLVSECDISHTGRGGIVLEGGDEETLAPAHSRADNNFIHDWAEVYPTYMPAVALRGVGNICSHNEICRAPHAAILYSGNDHLIEYNYIHDVVLHSSDAGAIYSGQYWSMQGTVIRYNCLCDIGGGEFRPDGIYFDDALSGQTAYGNLILNAKKNGFLIGGGRDNQVWGNLVIHAGCAFTYDDRLRDGLLHNGWAKHSVEDPQEGCMWVRLRQSNYRKPAWQAKYPSLAKISQDFSQPDDPEFAVNPAHSEVFGNIVIDEGRNVGRFDPSVRQFSTIHSNFAYATLEEAGFDEQYRLKPDAQARKDLPDFADIPLCKIGRY